MWWTSDTPERTARLGCAEGFMAAHPTVCTIVAMAYQEFAGRIWQLTGNNPELIDKKMFAEMAFLIRRNVAIAASSQSGAFCAQVHALSKRVPPYLTGVVSCTPHICRPGRRHHLVRLSASSWLALGGLSE